MWKCSEPYNTAYLEQKHTGLTVGPCCVATTELYDSSASLNNQPYLQKIRNDFDNNKIPSACAYCIKSEQNGYTSRRQSTGQEPVVNTLKNLEIHLGNYCNLKCVICNNRFSSAWQKDTQAMGLPTFDNFKFDPKNIDVDLSTVEWLHFNGGEPLFTDTHLKILERIPNPQHCSVYYNTNGTIRVNDSVFDIWSKFKLVKLVFSIDDVGERFNYQRTNADWSTVEGNMFWYRDVAPTNMMFGINRTVSRLNVDHLSDLNEWISNKFNTNRLGDLNDFSEQVAHGITALDSDTRLYNEYISKLNSIRS
jgi:uncharacterized radical SAM superfamily Fe-S cluster-containing enzyme